MYSLTYSASINNLLYRIHKVHDSFCKILLVLRQHNIDSFHFFVIFQGVHQDGSVNVRIVCNQMDQDLEKEDVSNSGL